MNTFGSQSELKAGGKTYEIFRLSALEQQRNIRLSRLPFSLRILLENLLRYEDGKSVTADDIEFLAKWDPKAEPSREISWMPARVLMQDFTGVPAVVDLAAMRDAMKVLGGDPQKINPLQPAELVIDHSVQVDEYGTGNAYSLNAALEFQRNRERYAFLKWGQTAFRNFSAVPPGMGICHQVNLEYLARVVFTTSGARPQAYPDTLVGTDSHTTMINGLGVLGWGVGGIEAEAAMLGQPISMLVPQVVGFKLTGKLREGATATDLVLTVTEMLRKLGVVGKFVEFYGPGIAELPLADRATIGNMAPEYGATCSLAAPLTRSRSSRHISKNSHCSILPTRLKPSTPKPSPSTSPRSSPVSRAPNARRTASSSAKLAPASKSSCPRFSAPTQTKSVNARPSAGKAKAATPLPMATSSPPTLPPNPSAMATATLPTPSKRDLV